MAGQGFAPRPSKLFRTLGMALHYSYYLRRGSFYNNHFSQPPIGLSDPTEKGQFSNLAGKAIADLLSKRIDNSLLTVNYEAEMRLRGIPLVGQRPDLLAYTSSSTRFAIEAKGYTNGTGDMTDHKIQANSGNHIIPVNFSVASVSYNIYNSIRCNYHDPFNENVIIGDDDLINISKQYYSGFAEFLDNDYFEIGQRNYGEESFYEVGLSYRQFRKMFKDNSRFPSFMFHEIFDIYRPRLIIPVDVIEYSKFGITNQTKPFNYIQQKNLYIDNDRIGLTIE
ncbi:hypothetical protein [Flavobacterium microcysteis]|uniref:Uncharacterized protein n=1 Tax=Flavobacterium microcysteis TaxID=2596891 RepID=A0A501QMD6_9FLAO|nr:hypothetical protein [Flavobacterium microcysteis]TPD73753.1 hypothetical protein FJA49_00215 [Flavobacterium microcysteis]